jgi:putative Mg2+ transporter-C (MgtC) family protein
MPTVPGETPNRRWSRWKSCCFAAIRRRLRRFRHSHCGAGLDPGHGYVVSGIGFLGAGAIMKEGLNVRGLNTAATLWCSAAIGAAAGAGLVAESGLLTLFVIAGNTLLRPLVNSINRIPIDEETSEATYEVRLSANLGAADEAREALIEALEKAHYPVSDVESNERGDDAVEIVATLIATAIVPEELDAVVEALEKFKHATWESAAQS